MPNKLSETDVAFLMNLEEKDVTKSLLVDLFAYGVTKKPRFNPNDTFVLKAGSRMKNKEPITTTSGRYIFNLFIVLPSFLDLSGYQNAVVTKKWLSDFEDEMSEWLLDRHVTAQQVIDYLNRIQWLGYVANDFMCPSMSVAIIRPHPDVMKRRAELVKKHKAALDKGDVVVASTIEEELLSYAKEKLKGDPSLDLYDSGAKGSWGNHYKSLCVMNGPIRDNATGAYNVSTSNFMEGIPKDEYHLYGDSIVYAAYSRAVGTQKGGYESKKMFAAFQTVTLDKLGSECGTKRTLDFVLEKHNKSLYLYRYIVEGNKLVRLTNSNIGAYVGKAVKLRSPMFCQNDKICNMCAGDLYYKLEIENVGLTTAKVASSLLNMSLKNFHDTTVKRYRIDWEKAIT